MDRRTITRWMLTGAAAVVLVPAAAGAQERDRGAPGSAVPPGHLPPPGECRVWYDGRPPGQQPPPTSCDAARREAYRTGGRVIYGGTEGRDDRDDRRDRG